MSDELDRLIDAGSIRYVVVGLPVTDLEAICAALDGAAIGYAHDGDGHLMVARVDEEATDAVFASVLGLELDEPGAGVDDAVLRTDGALVTVFEDNSQFTVEMMRERLTDAGIASAVGGGPGGGFTEVPMVVGIFHLRVHEDDADRAAAVLGTVATRLAPFSRTRTRAMVAVSVILAIAALISLVV